MAETCQTPAGMLSILTLDRDTFIHIMQRAADVTLAYGEPLTILGLTAYGAACCTNRCQFSHDNSVVVIPDVALIELISNGFSEEPTLLLQRRDGRSVRAYRISNPT